ncbi:MAG TPA: hypothetical protein VLF40_06340 [Candidatus Saccharimonadales bacterium]|nr:hypothetical protein [Candidatus Saccharimonadales bacterium]
MSKSHEQGGAEGLEVVENRLIVARRVPVSTKTRAFFMAAGRPIEGYRTGTGISIDRTDPEQMDFDDGDWFVLRALGGAFGAGVHNRAKERGIWATAAHEQDGTQTYWVPITASPAGDRHKLDAAAEEALRGVEKSAAEAGWGIVFTNEPDPRLKPADEPKA